MAQGTAPRIEREKTWVHVGREPTLVFRRARLPRFRFRREFVGGDADLDEFEPPLEEPNKRSSDARTELSLQEGFPEESNPGWR